MGAQRERAGEEIRRKLNVVATDPRYAGAAGRFAGKYAGFDPAGQGGRMVGRIEELLGAGGRQRGGCVGVPAAGVPAGVFRA